jgi:death on curing protein
MHAIARNHALIDGNTRLAWAATRIFCLLNGPDLDFTVDEAEALVVAVAAGKLEVDEIVASIETTSFDCPRGTPPIVWGPAT